jgi:hypothetical protein
MGVVMSARRILLVVLLVALGLCVLSAIVALGVKSNELMWQILWCAIVTAVACGLMLPLTLLTDRPKLRLCGFISMSLVLLLWLNTLAFILVESSSLLARVSWEMRDAVEMSFGIHLLMGIPSVGVSLLNRFTWARRAVPAFLAGAAGGWLLCEFGAVIHGLVPVSVVGYNLGSFFLMSGMTLFGCSVLAAELLINSGCGDRRRFRWPGIAAAATACLLFLSIIWSDAMRHYMTEGVSRAAVELLILAMLLGHVNLLLMARLRRAQSWVGRITIVSAAAGAALAMPLPFLTYEFSALTEVLVRAVASMAIMTGCGSVALVVLSMLNRKPEVQLVPGALTATDITLFCPRCQTRQTLAIGDGACRNCELKISVKVVEPRCPGCGYLLYQLTSSRCPECGASIREGDLAGAAPPEPAPVSP